MNLELLFQSICDAFFSAFYCRSLRREIDDKIELKKVGFYQKSKDFLNLDLQVLHRLPVKIDAIDFRQ